MLVQRKLIVVSLLTSFRVSFAHLKKQSIATTIQMRDHMKILV